MIWLIIRCAHDLNNVILMFNRPIETPSIVCYQRRQQTGLYCLPFLL